MLPTLAVNRSFMAEFIAADPPCFALGLVEVEGEPCVLVALRPGQPIPSGVTAKGFLISPQGTSVTAEDKARIRDSGFFNQC